MTKTDYSSLFNNSNFFPTWQEYYDFSLSYPENILNFCKKTVKLPHDFYRIIATYALIPSALVKRIPYLFLYGESGSGKSTLAKLIAYIHGVIPVTSSTTYAAIRNELRDRKKTEIIIPPSKDGYPYMSKSTEANIFMVLEDLDTNTLSRNPNLYALFKCGYDKATDTIKMSGERNGTNESFRCFSPKVFSSIRPIHTMEEYQELRRRLLVIPFKKEDCEVLEIDNLDWTGFSDKFSEFWSYEQAEILLTIRSSLRHIKALTSTQKAISLDLIAVGVSTGIWADETEAVQDLKNCFDWLKEDVKVEQAPLKTLLQGLIKETEKTARAVNSNPCIYSNQLRMICDSWFAKGFLFSKPTSKEVIKNMNELGYRINSRGQWEKRF